MPPQSSAQKAAVANFVSITGATERTATKFLKNTGYKINEAVDSYFQSSASTSSGHNKELQLNKLFDSLRNDAEDPRDALGADSSMKYLQNIGVDLEGASLFVAMELVQAPSIGEITRQGFVTGWRASGADAKLEAQKQHFRRLIDSLARDRDLFRRVYRYTFIVGKEPDQRALSLENAIVYWEMLFKKPGQRWIGHETGVDYLTEWVTFLREKWTRSVSRDMWNQTFEFAIKSAQDETLSFWSEDGAWPGVIDDFVAWYKRKVDMEVDA
ncbi:DUF298-domain-containing protein [Xylariaceae sp. FL0662B]|nr:DUF298-domain-containing protein [Xylariaceae sp. FL0662B]